MRWTRDPETREYLSGPYVIVPSHPSTTGYPPGWVLCRDRRQLDHYHYLADAKAAVAEMER